MVRIPAGAEQVILVEREIDACDILSPRERQVVEAINRHPGSTSRELAGMVGLSFSRMEKYTPRLIEKGLVKKITGLKGFFPADSNTKPPTYHLSPATLGIYTYIRTHPGQCISKLAIATGHHITTVKEAVVALRLLKLITRQKGFTANNTKISGLLLDGVAGSIQKRSSHLGLHKQHAVEGVVA